MGVGFRSVGFSDSKKQLSPAGPDHDHLVDYGCLKVHRLVFTLKKKNIIISILNYGSKYMQCSKESLFVMTQTHNLQIFGVIPFVELHKNT